MRYNYITLRPDRLDLPLDPCSVGRASSAVFIVGGEVPADITALVVKIGHNDGDTSEWYTAAGTRQADGTWRVYLAPSYFPAATDELEYSVVSSDAEENARWLGTGRLRIFENPANGVSPVPSVIPQQSYAYNPTTGLYYKIFAEVNSLGQIVFSASQEGVREP